MIKYPYPTRTTYNTAPQNPGSRVRLIANIKLFVVIPPSRSRARSLRLEDWRHAAMDDEQGAEEFDFDLELTESEYDFGRLDALDSDNDDDVQAQAKDDYDPDDTLDPFTAAQLEEAKEQRAQGRGSDDLQNDRSFQDDADTFTQRLLTNARTLKQLRPDGPKVELELDESREGVPGNNSAGGRPALERTARQSFSERYRELSQEHAINQLPSFSDYHPSQTTPLKKPVNQFSQVYMGVDKQIFQTCRYLGPDEEVVGKHEVFPARLLQPLSYEIFRRVLDRTRRYRFDEDEVRSSSGRAMAMDPTCLYKLSRGVDASGPPVFEVTSRHGANLLLVDEHEEPCEIVATLLAQQDGPHSTDDWETLTGVQLLDFHFDYACLQETLDLQQQQRQGQSPARRTFSQASIPDADLPSPQLVIVRGAPVSWDAFVQQRQAFKDSRSKASEAFEVSDKLTRHESILLEAVEDFPVQLSDTL
ncbi:hypothetical protein PYCC9005_000201 [Savitreella phatthalungensis]